MAIKNTSGNLARKKTKAGNTSSYDSYKEFEGSQYTGMKVGRTHHWKYDKGDWREKKITPEKWEFTYDVVKRRTGHAPEGSGVPVGTGYHWFILANQYAEKLDANDYTTQMVGLKFKLSHKRAGKDNWNAGGTAQRKHLIQILQSVIAELKRDPEEILPVPIELEYKKTAYKGIGIPVMSTCKDGVCFELDITLNDKHLGVLRKTEKGWKINEIKQQGLARAIGEFVTDWYQKKK
jgi:hypothetical protein